jgi:hypothetical protein
MKKCQVVMLPTNEKAEDCLATYYNSKMSIVKGLLTKSYLASAGIKCFHLYFLSDEEIKEGDWMYKDLDKKPIQWDGDMSTTKNPERYGYKKIIATTDSSLKLLCKCNSGIDWWHNSKATNCEHEIEDHYNKALRCDLKLHLPQPSQSFLEVFVTEYNKGNQIKEVLVEYEENWKVDEECPTGLRQYKTGNTLKISSKDNTITIKKVKDSWSREEVIQLASNVFRAGHERGFSGYPRTENWTKQTLENWIEQNL